MHNSERIKIFLEKFDIGEPAASEFVSLFFGFIKQALAEGGRVEIRGFGSF